MKGKLKKLQLIKKIKFNLNKFLNIIYYFRQKKLIFKYMKFIKII